MTTVSKIVDSILALSVADFVELIGTLAPALGVDKNAATAVAVAAPAAAAPAEAAAEKSSFDVCLTAAGDGKINVIKVVREITGLGLKEAKDLVDACGVVKAGCAKAEAEEICKKLTDAGATAVMK
jgi:large subunit ribosomal protein L7/L12